MKNIMSFDEHVNESLDDYSTGKLKSNINKKWVRDKDISDDIKTYISIVYTGNGINAAQSIVNSIINGIEKIQSDIKKETGDELVIQ